MNCWWRHKLSSSLCAWQALCLKSTQKKIGIYYFICMFSLSYLCLSIKYFTYSALILSWRKTTWIQKLKVQLMLNILSQAWLWSTTALKCGVIDQAHLLCHAAPPNLWHGVITATQFKEWKHCGFKNFPRDKERLLKRNIPVLIFVTMIWN